MKEFINKNLVSLIVLALVIVVYLQRCGGGGGNVTIPQNTHDTTTKEIHHYHEITIYKTNYIPSGHIPAKPSDIPSTMAPDTNYSRLVGQFDSLKQLYYSKNIYKDSIPLDTIGYVDITDTIGQNRLLGRKWHPKYSITEKITTITNTIYPPQRFQVYFGGEILGNEKQIVDGAALDLLFKTKKDRIYTIGVEKLLNYPITYKLGSFWKINLRKGP
jgi:hypothetical protein